MDKCLWVGAGYPVFVLAVAALWKALHKKDSDVKRLQQEVLDEKERHIKELEEFKKLVERKKRGGRHDSF